jgi:hypothetical protein
MADSFLNDSFKVAMSSLKPKLQYWGAEKIARSPMRLSLTTFNVSRNVAQLPRDCSRALIKIQMYPIAAV